MRFLVFSDSKGKEHGINKKILKKLLSESLRLASGTEFIVVCGDSVAGSTNESILKSQLYNFKETINDNYPNKMILPVIGNHEVNIIPDSVKYELIFKEVYNDFNSASYLEGYNNTAYFMDFDDTRIIILNSFHYNEVNKVTNEQLNWFNRVSSINKTNKIVFIHSPEFPTGAHYTHSLDLYPECRDSFIEIAKKNHIDFIISGHEHNYSRRIIPDSKIIQVISGGSGEKLRDKFKDKEGVIIPPIPKFHFLIVDVIGRLINVTAIDISGNILDTFYIEK